MAYYVNELSLHNQYQSINDFEVALATVLLMRHQAVAKSVRYYCSIDIRSKHVLQDITLDKAVTMLADRSARTQLYRWFDEDCWFSERQHSLDDLYEFDDDDVTGTSLAEVAFRIGQGQRDSLISFSLSRFTASQINVLCHVANANATSAVCPNYFELDGFTKDLEVEQTLRLNVEINSWPSLIEWLSRNCINLKFAPYLMDPLRAEPFYPLVARRVKELLTALDNLVVERQDDGSWTERGNEIYQRYFIGHRPAFTDESDTNKTQHSQDLTFIHPDRAGETMFCPFHGKINNPVFRVHFSWPIDEGGVYVVYIGQKLTKD